MNDSHHTPENTCDGQCLKRLVAAAVSWLEHKHQQINTLNVFPVPDGDTGTNMLLTMRSAHDEIAGMSDTNVGAVAHAISHGALMGARGNSGVILSQLWRGFARVMADAECFDAGMLAVGLREACDTAYKGVIKPVEGTILTVSRAVAEAAETAAAETDDVTHVLERIVFYAGEALARTPEQLPVLKQAGVVDSGGAGLVAILEGMLLYVQGGLSEAEIAAEAARRDTHTRQVLTEEDVFSYPYDVQFIVHGEGLDVLGAREAIEVMGDCALVVGDDATIKVHVHVKDPGQPISYGAGLGLIGDVVVENMLEQSRAFFGRSAAPALPVPEPASGVRAGDIAVIAVVSGSGLTKVFQSLGVADLVPGGQSMNPSTEELLTAVRGVPTDRIVLLPNNKNILLAARQAAQMAAEEDIDVRVVPTVTLPQGISALMAFQPDGDLDEVAQAMSEAKDMVTTAEITNAIRSVEIDGVAVQEGQIIGLIDGTLIEAGDDLDTLVLDLLQQMKVTDYELITLYYGNGVSSEQAQALADSLRARFAEQEVEVIHGGQPHYHYILSTE
ncbi:MAG: DAK2 domain-containing protein [Anaerolineae bacterium]|nr:DAK2 domain-containing protein [Anaerolineae bacterium]